jgi:hypothetical protein
MPQLENAQHERVAHGVAKGATWTAACEKAGYSATNRNVLQSRAYKLKQLPEIVERVEEIQGDMVVAITSSVAASAEGLDEEASSLYGRCTQARPVVGPGGVKTIKCKCGEEHRVNVWRFDVKNAIGLLNFRAKLAGLFVTNVNVRTGKLNEIEGTLDQIWERIANMAEPLGREFKEWIIARWGYEVVPANLRVVEGIAADVAEAPEAAS